MFEINYRAIFCIFAPFFLKKTLDILDILNFVPKYFQEYSIYAELTKIQQSLRLNKKKVFHRAEFDPKRKLSQSVTFSTKPWHEGQR